MKRIIICLIAIVIATSLLAACGNSGGKSDPVDGSAADLSSIKTIGEAQALGTDESNQYSIMDGAYVYVLEHDGSYWRFIASLTEEQSEALWALDISEPDYDAKLAELVSPLAVTKCENLDGMKLTDEEMDALVGKTGADLLDDGFISGMGYNLDEMEFYLERAPFAYTVTFEAEEKLVNTDDFDEEEAIRPLKVTSVRFDGLGQSATDVQPGEADSAGAEADVSEVDYLVLVNKQHKLPANWEAVVQLEDARNTIPEGVELNEDNDYLADEVFKVEPEALAAFRALQADLEKDGIIILLDSTYRSVARQEELWAEFEAEYGPEYTRNTVAEPGTSEHHTGLAIDVCIVKDGVVINENSAMIAERDIFAKIHAKLADYGFILRFPENGKAITGYDYEPWHFRYVGVDVAKEIAAQDITLEEYLGELPEAAE